MSVPTKYVVNVSGGLSSYEAWRRTVERFGRENVVPVFADVRGDSSRDPHAAPDGTNWDGEDEDVYRFLDDIERLMGQEINRVRHPEGIGVWGAIFKERAIVIPGPNTFAPCTKLLKQQTLDAFATEVRQEHGAAVVQVIGLSYQEDDRIAKARKRMGDAVMFPLEDSPLVDSCHIADALEQSGVKPPRMYQQGYPHANCGGACVKAGQAQWALLLRTNRGRFGYNEAQEAWFRRDINPNVSILTEEVKGVKYPLPLQLLRERIEAGWRYNRRDWGGCGCFAQARMGDLLLEVPARKKEAATC